ncbi:hypothetical protein EVAR_23645_1 [Eumeta japonica]|uniref:Uncharacterized protein n=1 Tax=Eumeta variegata TaxID=151549 RepID=A0A4C1VIN3_EUMVA|nr:hypothetical protein EVAR_23645_1 [Eumeta japonica]
MTFSESLPPVTVLAAAINGEDIESFIALRAKGVRAIKVRVQGEKPDDAPAEITPKRFAVSRKQETRKGCFATVNAFSKNERFVYIRFDGFGLRLGVTYENVTLGNVTMSHRTRACLSHSTMIGLPRAD